MFTDFHYNQECLPIEPSVRVAAAGLIIKMAVNAVTATMIMIATNPTLAAVRILQFIHTHTHYVVLLCHIFCYALLTCTLFL
jgi:hypothetical protein